MQALVVPKGRKPKFDLTLKIIDLNNIPYVSGKIQVRWSIAQTTDHSDRTIRAQIKDHKAVFDYEKVIPLRLVIDKNGVLQESQLVLEVMHEIQSHHKDERVLLGVVRLNLAEYVEASGNNGDEGIQRRYLLQESKINSTLKVIIHMLQTEGDRNFEAPPLKVAPVFVGIAGVMTGEVGDSEDSGQLPAVGDRAKEAGDELRELYRRTLAADYTLIPGEPSADQVIEDIFAGGDGWGNREESTDPGSLSDGELRTLQRLKREWTEFQFSKRRGSKRASRESLTKVEDAFADISRSRGSFGQHSHPLRAELEEASRSVPEQDELELREDLKCWNVRPMR